METLSQVRQIPLCADIAEDANVSFKSLCGCGDITNHPFCGESRETEAVTIVECIRRKTQAAVRKQQVAEPPNKKQRTSIGTASARNESTSEPVVVVRETLKLDCARPYLQCDLDGPIKYTALNDDIRTHVARIEKSDGTTSMRLVIWEHQEDDDYCPLIDITCSPSAITTDLEAVHAVGLVSHLNLKASTPGRFWAETSFVAIPDGYRTQVVVTWELKWDTVASLGHNRRHASKHKGIVEWMMLRLMPGHNLESGTTPQDFYQSLHVPDPDDPISASMMVDELVPNLYPYQRRSVRWMLGREEVDWSPATKSLISLPKGMSVGTLHKVIDEDNQTFWVSPVYDLVTASRVNFENHDISGGLLLEEMGLGKTIEVISLILMHQRHLVQAGSFHDPVVDAQVTPIRATLIICPPSILKQWEEEIDSHAPSLNTFIYEGVRANRKRAGPELLKLFATADVVLTTYQVVAKEVHYLAAPILRTRNQSQHRSEPVISPLIQFSWWRTILDEVQMIGSGASNAARVAKTIPRVHAWGVTGTPVKGDLNGVHSLLEFLRYEPFASDKSAWKALLTRDRPMFKALCQKVAIRHTKQMVKSDISVPAQKRFVMVMPFTPIEEQHYKLLFSQMCRQIDLSETGEPLIQNWSLDKHATEMLQWLTQLRLNALYPSVEGVAASRRQQKRVEPKTAAELLQVMLSDNLAALHRFQRELLMSRIDRGKYHALSFNIKEPEEALRVWLEVYKDAEAAVKGAKESLRNANKAYELSKKSRSKNPSEIEETQNRVADAAATSTIATLTSRLTAMLVVQHTVTFLCGNANFALSKLGSLEQKEQYKRQEEVFYAKAKDIRQDILDEILSKCQDMMSSLNEKQSKIGQRSGLKEIPGSYDHIPEPKDLDNIAPHAASLVYRLWPFLYQQRRLILEWRSNTVRLLVSALVDSRPDGPDEEIIGDEYEQSAKDQDRIVLQVMALRALIEDRNDVLSGGTNQLVLADMRDMRRLAGDGQGPDPEKAMELCRQRSALLETADGATFVDIQTALKSRMGELKTEISRGRNDNATRNLAVVENWFRRIRVMVAAHLEVVNALRAEYSEMSKLMNARVEFYRQLQTLSDHVRDWDHYDTFANREHVLPRMIAREHAITQEISKLSAMRKYLEHLESPNIEQDGLPDCLICTDKYQYGSMTICGHLFCRNCLALWWGAHRTCPMCKKHLKRAEIHDVTHKVKELKAHEEEAMPIQLAKKGLTQSAIYARLPKKALDEIMNTPIVGHSWTTKVDTICRHIIWLKKKDPSTKCLVFTQYTHFLEYLKHALWSVLAPEGIKTAAIAEKDGIHKFKTDPECGVFLLDAKSQSSGLNLVEANHVFLMEPLINTAIELQAISRVDRIGQKKETTVWLYVVDGTVEENIYDISVRRRLEHIPQKRNSEDNDGREKSVTPGLEVGLQVANAAELAQYGDIRKLLNGAGEMVPKGDLMETLFANRIREEGKGDVDMDGEWNEE